MKKIKSVISWRLHYLKQQRLKLFWVIKSSLDFSKKEKVNAVSVVVVGRNDNYGGNFSKRLQVTLDWNLNHLPNPELIYIEWNQIPDKESDCNWIVERYKNTKCYVVSEKIHKSVCTNTNMPVFEYFAKNIGIRKATNDWILIINADVFIGHDVKKNIRYLNKKYVYGTHYINIEWDGNSLSNHHLINKNIRKTCFSANQKLSSVVGNFILTHRDNWNKATGYDEKLNFVRAGVDNNGLEQLYYYGIKPMIIGHHLHLDHKESIMQGNNPSHGTFTFDNIPYKNADTWGFINYNEKQISDRIWELEKI